jgi:hypothetical protein
MPSFTINDIKNLQCDNIDDYKIFIETGTYMGDTIFSMEPHFDKLYTVEIKPEFYYNNKNRYNGQKINFILGDSTYEIENICKNIKEKSIFFLDGHWSAGNTGKGEKDIPLIEEINSIYNYFDNEAIVIIDDRRMFGKGPNKGTDICNWEDISEEKITEILKDRIEKMYYLSSPLDSKDRLIYHIKSKI